jgi:hypothetical protein
MGIGVFPFNKEADYLSGSNFNREKERFPEK